MGIYNFADQFVPDIEADRKRHTIRAKRKYPDKPGDLLYLYNRLRTKRRRRLKIRRCVRVQDIKFVTFIRSNTERRARPDLGVRVMIDGVRLSWSECMELARSDGFTDFYTMMEFWEGRLPFEGDLIHWESDADAQPHEAEYSKIRARNYQATNRLQRFQSSQRKKPRVTKK